MEFQWFLQKFEAFVGVNPWTMLFAWLNLLILYLSLLVTLKAHCKGIYAVR